MIKNSNIIKILWNSISHITIILLLCISFILLQDPNKLNFHTSVSTLTYNFAAALTMVALLVYITYRFNASHKPSLYTANLGVMEEQNNCCLWASAKCKHPLERDLTGPTIFTVSQPEDPDQESRKAENTELSPQTICEFLANLGHELRTPMIGILGSVDLLEHSPLNHLQMSSVQAIRECGERLLITIDDILQACKIDTGMVELNPSYTNLSYLVKKTIDSLENNLANKKLLLELDLDCNLPSMVMVDQAKLRQIIVNLLSNAIKFTPSGGIKLTVKTETAATGATWLLVSITDTGIGIPPNQLGTMFNCITQGDNSSSRQFSGNGLGLYVCRQLISLMGGRMWVKSKEDFGSTFSFKVPVEISVDKKQPDMSAQVVSMLEDDTFYSGFIPVTVLLAEDNDLNQKLLGQMLLSYGFEVITASNGLECLSILQRKNVDIVLMDMQMPVMDGYEATRLIRRNPSWEQLPVIAITANSLSGDRQKCLNCGCSSYLAKPFKSEALIREIKTYLKNQFIKDKNSERVSEQLIAELMPEFMEMLNETLAELKEAIELKDLHSIKQISHGLKGTAGMYGFMQISELAALIENALTDKNYSRMKMLYQQITVFVKEIHIKKSGVVI